MKRRRPSSESRRSSDSRRFAGSGLAIAALLAFACTHTPDPAAQGPEDDDAFEAPAPIPIPSRSEDPAPGTRLDESAAGTDRAGPADSAPHAEPARPPPEPEPPARRVPRAARTAFEEGVRAAERGDWSSAEARFAAAVAADPELVWGWYNLGMVRDRSGDEAGAAEAWRRASVIDSEFTPAISNLARQMVRQGRAREAERMLRQRVSEHPANLDLRNELAQVMVVQGTAAKLDAAFAEARQVLSVDERNVGALLVLGQVFYRQDKFELAEWVVERVLAIEPTNAAAHNLMGFLHLRQDRRREAFASFRHAAGAGSERPEIYVNYGAFLNQAQDFEEAVLHLEKAVRYAPRMPEARLNLGNAYRGAGEYRKALQEYEKVRELDPENTDVLLNMALVYLDGTLAEMDTVARLERAQSLLEAYRSAGGDDDRLADFVRDADRALDVERRRLEREGLRERQEAEEREARRAEEAERARREAEAAFRARRAAEEEAARRAEAGEEDEEAPGTRLGEENGDEDEEDDDEGSRLQDSAEDAGGTVLGGEDL